jgi:hypothetical protein
MSLETLRKLMTAMSHRLSEIFQPIFGPFHGADPLDPLTSRVNTLASIGRMQAAAGELSQAVKQLSTREETDMSEELAQTVEDLAKVVH